MRSTLSPARVLRVLVIVLGLVTVLSAGTSAQNDPDGQYNVVVISSTCDASLNDTADATCEALPGATILFNAENGTLLGQCVTELGTFDGAPSASCTFPVDYGTTVIVSQDPATVPEGYVLFQNNLAISVPEAGDGLTGATAAGNAGIYSIPVDAQPTTPASEPGGYPVTAYLCDTDPGNWSPYSGREIGGGCEPSPGIRFNVTAQIDPTYSEVCTTGDTGTCYLQNAPYLADEAVLLTITEDVSSLPDGYAPRENPVSGGNYTEFRGTTFINILTTDARSSAVPASTEQLTAETDGSTAAIYAGACDGDFAAEPVATLTNVRPPDGETAGAETASAVETSFTTLDLPLDDLLAEDHVLVVFDEADDSVALACGAIGGIVTDDRTLTFGLEALDESRFSGVAYLSEDGDQTLATIFLAEDLSAVETVAA